MRGGLSPCQVAGALPRAFSAERSRGSEAKAEGSTRKAKGHSKLGTKLKRGKEEAHANRFCSAQKPVEWRLVFSDLANSRLQHGVCQSAKVHFSHMAATTCSDPCLGQVSPGLLEIWFTYCCRCLASPGSGLPLRKLRNATRRLLPNAVNSSTRLGAGCERTP